MALIQRSNPIGVDLPITRFQKFLYNEVKKVWNITDDSLYACYDRAYRELIDIGYVPRLPMANSQGILEYQTVGFNPDLYSAMSFFSIGLEMKEIENRTSKIPVALIFAVNLEKVKPNIIDHRADEEARVDIEKICYVPRFNFEFTGAEIGFENIFREYKGVTTQDKQQYLDLHPIHYFRINFNLIYDIFDC